MNGQASGHFSLDVQEVTGDTITATTTFVDIPTSTSTKVTMDFTDGSIANAGSTSRRRRRQPDQSISRSSQRLVVL